MLKKKKKQEEPVLSQPGTVQKKKTGGKLEVSLKWFIILHLSLVVNSMAGAASKMAGRQKFLSLKFFFYYGLVLFITFAFALVWQQVLKHMSLTFAFTNKPITMIWGIVWGIMIFQEQFTLQKLLGTIVVLIGIIIGVSGNE